MSMSVSMSMSMSMSMTYEYEYEYLKTRDLLNNAQYDDPIESDLS